MRRGAALLVLLAACGDEVDAAWQLDHDRVIALRSTPPRIVSGEVAALDALIGRKGQPPREVDPDTATVDSPASLAAALNPRSGSEHWSVTAPDEDALVAARSELALAAGAPVPLRLRVTFADTGEVAYKIIWLGEHVENLALGPILIDGADASSSAALTVAPEVDVRLAVDFDDSYTINWLTSCGTMHDFDLARAYLRVEPEDAQSGSMAVVVRDALGGVAWRVWPITAE